MINPNRSEIEKTPSKSWCRMYLDGILMILALGYVIMCITYDLYYCMKHNHLAGMIWIYTCGTMSASMICCTNCICLYGVSGETSPSKQPKLVCFYIICGIVSVIGKIVSIIIFTLNDEEKINIGINPDSIAISLINFAISFSPGVMPVIIGTIILFIIGIPVQICYICYETEHNYHDTIPDRINRDTIDKKYEVTNVTYISNINQQPDIVHETNTIVVSMV